MTNGTIYDLMSRLGLNLRQAYQVITMYGWAYSIPQVVREQAKREKW